ncbi:MAG: hypothetical protein LDLANPLL_00299 [Turneriella sp.]|nr:hypothetical protein [Turneriella sp.]
MFRRMSLIGRLSLSFFIFTLINLLLFWLASGSNQMRLIAEKSSLEMYRSLTDTEARLKQTLRENSAATHVSFYRNEKAVAVLADALKPSTKSNAHTLIEFGVVSNDNTIYLSWPKKNTNATLEPTELQNLIKALRLKEFNNEPFYSAANVLDYQLTVYIPFFSENGREIILRAVYSMDSMRTELMNLMRLGIAIVALLLLVQAGLAFILYRFLVRPLKKLRVASEVIGRGELAQVKGYEKRGDEIGSLVHTFNKMSTDITEQKETIQKNFEEIKARDAVMQHELMIAKQIQKSIIPKGKFPHPIAIEFKPLVAVSGDFYDVYKFKDGSFGYVVCDASGHGVPAALLTMLAKAAFLNVVENTQDPAEIMSQVNNQLAESLDMTGQYLTAFFLHVTDSEIVYCNATHPEPLLVYQGVEKLKSTGFYVGMMLDTPFPFEKAILPRKSGQKIILYTDGITEARNKEGVLFGINRLSTLVQENKSESVEYIKQKILDALATFTEGVSIEDDITLMVLEL